jgi:hypothetical protein
MEALQAPAPPLNEKIPEGILAFARSIDPDFQAPRARSRSQ